MERNKLMFVLLAVVGLVMIVTGGSFLSALGAVAIGSAVFLVLAYGWLTLEFILERLESRFYSGGGFGSSVSG